MTKDELWMAWNEFKKLLELNKIPYSLSPMTARVISKNEKVTPDNFRISLWWKDFFDLKYFNNSIFLTNDETNEKDLSPFFKYQNKRIYIDLIVGTTKEKCKNLYSFKTHNRLLFWGKNKINLATKMFGSKSKIFGLKELINTIKEDIFLRLIVLSSCHDDFRFFSDLNWKTVELVKINDEYFPVFSQFLKTEEKIND